MNNDTLGSRLQQNTNNWTWEDVMCFYMEGRGEV
jgi:hypothetical protein